MPREYNRNDRLSGQMLRLLNELVRQDIKDPRLSGVSISAVDIARDLAVADVYFSLLGLDDDPEPVLEGLHSAAGFLRSRVGRALKIRHTPQLRFHHDDSAARGAEISALIQSAKPESDNDPESETEPDPESP